MKPILSAIALFVLVGAANDHNTLAVLVVALTGSLVVFAWGMRGEKYDA